MSNGPNVRYHNSEASPRTMNSARRSSRPAGGLRAFSELTTNQRAHQKALIRDATNSWRRTAGQRCSCCPGRRPAGGRGQKEWTGSKRQAPSARLRSYSLGKAVRLPYGRDQTLAVPTIGALVKPRISARIAPIADDFTLTGPPSAAHGGSPSSHFLQAHHDPLTIAHGRSPIIATARTHGASSYWLWAITELRTTRCVARHSRCPYSVWCLGNFHCEIIGARPRESCRTTSVAIVRGLFPRPYPLANSSSS